jgi:hypothetical protein
MKKLLILITLLTISTTSQAGIVGRLSSEAQDWEFIQKNGGIQIAAPFEKEGQRVLPVTCYVAKYNSAMVVRRVEVKRKDLRLAIRIITSLVEQGRVNGASGFVNYADITDVPIDRYDVYYEHFGDKAKYLGVIDIK